MGNKLCRRRHVVEEKYTRPQGLYQHKDVDHKKLRKLILDSKLAPCYPGGDDCACDLDECPICFLFYPSLNRSRCCMKGICTECFLQMKTPNSTRPTQCPFCKMLNYAVEYRGVKTKEEKGMEQIEEQRVIEAKIRMRQQELHDEEERMQKRHEMSYSTRIAEPREVENLTAVASSGEGKEIVFVQQSSAAPIRQPLSSRQNTEDELDLDLEDIMVMEAIWMSIQEDGKQRNHVLDEGAPSEQYVTDTRVSSSSMAPQTESSSSSSSTTSPSGGLACAIAALAEHQETDGESSSSTSTYSENMSTHSKQVSESYLPAGSHLHMARKDEGLGEDDHGLDVVGGGGGYAAHAGAVKDHDCCTKSDYGSPFDSDSFDGQRILANTFLHAKARGFVVKISCSEHGCSRKW